MIYFNENRAAIKGVNQKGEEIEYGKYCGSDRVTREIDEYFSKIKYDNSFVIDWGDETGTVYIDENEKIMKLLKSGGNLINKKMEQIEFADGKRKISVKLNEKNDKITPEILIDRESIPFKFLSDEYILVENKIYDIF